MSPLQCSRKRSANIVLVLLHLREGGECSSDQAPSHDGCCLLYNVYMCLQLLLQAGGLAHMVERSLSMREVPGSMPGFSTFILLFSPLTKNSSCNLFYHNTHFLLNQNKI